MEDQEKDLNIPEQREAPQNPNSIGEIISFGKDLPTRPDMVYRSVRGRAAVDDINSSGIVRNAQSAGVTEKSRWGERVFWSQGAEGKYHIVGEDSFVIEAPLAIARERVVTKEDITSIYTKNETGTVIDILKEQKELEQRIEADRQDERKANDETELRVVRSRLGLEQ